MLQLKVGTWQLISALLCVSMGRLSAWLSPHMIVASRLHYSAGGTDTKLIHVHMAFASSEEKHDTIIAHRHIVKLLCNYPSSAFVRGTRMTFILQLVIYLISTHLLYLVVNALPPMPKSRPCNPQPNLPIANQTLLKTHSLPPPK